MELQETFDDLATAPAAETHAAPSQAPRARIQLWDLPIRIFHWSLLAAVSTAIVTGKVGGDWIVWHGKAGQAIVGLLAFRLTWGFVGSTHARFVNFVPSPAKVLAYLQGRWQGVGHNPLGALSVLALLGLLGIQAVTGVFSNDDIAFTGPLAGLVDETLSHKLTTWHHLLVNGLFVLLGLHLAAILYHVVFKKDNLVKPMVTGWKEVAPKTKPPRQGGPVALLVSVSVAVSAVYLVSGAWIKSPAPAVQAAPAAGSSTTTGTTTTPAAPAW